MSRYGIYAILIYGFPSPEGKGLGPGRTPATAQVVTVSFHAQGDSTRVTLTHSGWEALGDAAAETREGYTHGWDIVLGQFFVNQCTKIAAD
jgi:hypothetical protein